MCVCVFNSHTFFQLIFMMLPGQHTNSDPHMIDQFTEHYLATDHLPRALMRTYISELAPAITTR